PLPSPLERRHDPLAPLVPRHADLRGRRLALSSAARPQDKEPDQKPGDAPPAKFLGLSDAGTLYLYVHEEILFRNTFTWKTDGSFQGNIVEEGGGKKVPSELTITPDKEGYWTHIEYTVGKEKLVITREGDQVKFTQGDKSASGKLKAGAF